VYIRPIIVSFLPFICFYSLVYFEAGSRNPGTLQRGRDANIQSIMVSVFVVRMIAFCGVVEGRSLDGLGARLKYSTVYGFLTPAKLTHQVKSSGERNECCSVIYLSLTQFSTGAD